MDSAKKRTVIKIGTGVLTRDGGVELHHAMIARLAHSISELNQAGHECILVSSGAVGAGLSTFSLASRPDDIGMLQACAAAGQARLMHVYESQFSNYHLKVAQLLVTHEDLDNGDRRANFHSTLTHLLDFPAVIPIINENDSVAVYELKVGDNDTLSSDVARLIDADLLIMLTSVPGLRRPDSVDENDIVALVEDIEQVMQFADEEEKGELSVGGMVTKLEAVKSAVNGGIETVIASGQNPEQLTELVNGEGVGTRFRPRMLLA